MTTLFYNILALSISVTPIILVLLCLGQVLNKNYSAQWRYIMWMAISIRLLLPVSFMNMARVSIQIPTAVTDGFTPSATVNGALHQINTGVLPAADIRLVHILGVIYFIGAISYLGYMISGYVGFRRNVLRWSRKPLDSGIERLLTELQRELNIDRKISVRINKKVSSPMIIGLVRPVLLLPSELYASTEMRMILIHELVHLQRHDIGYKLVLMLTTAMHWFNPVVHLMVREANRDMEVSCDNCVLRGTDIDAKKCYSSIILNLAMQNNDHDGPIFSTSIRSSKHTLESRIKGIFDVSKKRRGIAALTIIAVLVIISGTAVAISNAESMIPGQPTLSRLGDNLIDSVNPNDTLDYTIDETALKEKDINRTVPQASIKTGPEVSTPGNSQENNRDSGDYYARENAGAPTSNGSGAQVVIVDLNELDQQEETNTSAGR